MRAHTSAQYEPVERSMFMDEGGRASGVDVLAAGWIHEVVGAYGQSVTIYPKEHLVIAVNSASVDPHGIGLARWDLIAAIRGGQCGDVDCSRDVL